MSSFGNCPKCRRWDYMPRHECPPVWQVWCPDDGEEDVDARQIGAKSAEEAAELWAEKEDSHGDYRIVGGSDAVVHVRSADGTETRWRVRGEAVPEYHASQVPDEVKS